MWGHPREPEVVTSEVAGTFSVPDDAGQRQKKKWSWFLRLLLSSGDRTWRDYLFLYSAPSHIPIKPHWSGSWCREIAKGDGKLRHKQKSVHPIIWEGVSPNNNHGRNKWGRKEGCWGFFLKSKTAIGGCAPTWYASVERGCVTDVLLDTVWEVNEKWKVSEASKGACPRNVVSISVHYWNALCNCSVSLYCNPDPTTRSSSAHIKVW